MGAVRGDSLCRQQCSSCTDEWRMGARCSSSGGRSGQRASWEGKSAGAHWATRSVKTARAARATWATCAAQWVRARQRQGGGVGPGVPPGVAACMREGRRGGVAASRRRVGAQPPQLSATMRHPGHARGGTPGGTPLPRLPLPCVCQSAPRGPGRATFAEKMVSSPRAA